MVVVLLGRVVWTHEWPLCESHKVHTHIYGTAATITTTGNLQYVIIAISNIQHLSLLIWIPYHLMQPLL